MSILREDHVYSFSQLMNFYGCPYAFYLDKIERESQVSNIFAEQGTLIHDLIDQWAKNKLSKEDLPIEYAKRYHNEVITSAPKMLAMKGYEDKTYQQGLDYFINFDEFKGYKIIGTETKFRTDINGRPFVGVVDMICEEEKTGAMIILDHKSKSLSSFKKDEDDMYKQQYMYAKFFFEKYGRYPDKLVFNLFKEGGLKQERVFDINVYNETQKWAADIIERIENYEVIDFISECKEKEWTDEKGKKHSDGFFCENICSVREHCPNGVAAQPSKKGRYNR